VPYCLINLFIFVLLVSITPRISLVQRPMWELRTHDQTFPLSLFDDNLMEEIEPADFIFSFLFRSLSILEARQM
jgi:hypothetical protein